MLVGGLADIVREFPNPYHVVVKRTHVDNNVMIGDRRRQITSCSGSVGRTSYMPTKINKSK